MLVSDWLSVDARRDTGGDAMRCGATPAGIGDQCAGRRARRVACPAVTGINKTTDAVTLTYDPWGRARLDDAVGELECQGRRMVADREGVGADN